MSIIFLDNTKRTKKFIKSLNKDEIKNTKFFIVSDDIDLDPLDILPKKASYQYLKLLLPPPDVATNFIIKGDKNTYIIRKGSDTPEPVNKITFYADVPYTYPQCAVRVYFGTKQGLYHVNTWNDDNHRQCIDVWTKYSSIKSVIEKTLRAILYDEDVCRYESMANSLAKNWQQKKVREGEFPIYPSSVLFRKSIDISKPSVKRTKSVKTNPRCHPVVRKVIA